MNRLTKALFSSKSSEWATPTKTFEALDAEFHFDFDPCPLGGQDDGTARLLQPWTGKRVFCNPPYGPEIPKFLACWCDAEIAVFLLPARTDTRWFHDIVLPHAKEIRFIRGRLRFGNGNGPAPFPSMVVVFQKEQPI